MKVTKVILLIIILVLSVMLLTGCSLDYGELKGVVVDKKHTTEYLVTSYMYTGKTMIPTTQYYPETWKIEIQKEEERSDKNYLDKCFRGRV